MNKNTQKTWKEKKVYGQFARGVNTKTESNDQCLWMKRTDHKIETEAFICIGQKQALRIN